MATEFIGCTVIVTLHSPPNAQVRGVVVDISQQMLFLRDVYWFASGHRAPTFHIASQNLADLEVLPEEVQEIPLPSVQHPNIHGHERGRRPSVSPPQAGVNDSTPSSLRGSFSQVDPITVTSEPKHTVQSTAQSSAIAFQDPAILSISDPAILSISDPAILSTVRPTKDGGQKHSISSSADGPPPIPRQMLAEAVRNSPSKATPSIPESHLPPAQRRGFVRMESLATLSEPFDDLSIEKSQDEPESEAAELGTDGGKEQPGDMVAAGTKAGRRTRRAAKARRNQVTSTLPPHAEEADSSPVQVRSQMQILRRKSTRKESVVTAEPEPYIGEEKTIIATKQVKPRNTKAKRKERLKVTETANGWATEDATDIQELGDFDFLANHAKFDKKEIFKQMRQDDTTADELRLVSHNRRPKPGTRGGRDLHWSENVLDVPHAVSNGVAKWNSEAGDSEEEASEARVSSGRDSRRAQSRASLRRAPSRKGSSKGPELHIPSEANLGAAGIRPTVNTAVRSPHLDASSPRAKASAAASPYLASVPASKPSLRLHGTNKPCPTLSPLQMLEFEQFALTELGLSEEILAENAGRGIAQTALTVLREANKNATSVLKSHIVVAAGNHRSGARALAAARHLHCHGFRVTAALMGLDREEDWLDTVRQQMHAFRQAGGAVMRAAALLAGLKGGSVLPNLLIDALLGIHTIFDDLRGDDQAWFYEVVLLVNRNEWRVLSVDVPSGLDAVTGEIAHTDAAPSHALAFFPAAVVSLGAPKPWILATLRAAVPADGDRETAALLTEPAHYVADCGLAPVVWRRRGNRRSKGVEFAGEWVRALRYAPSGE